MTRWIFTPPPTQSVSVSLELKTPREVCNMNKWLLHLLLCVFVSLHKLWFPHLKAHVKAPACDASHLHIYCIYIYTGVSVRGASRRQTTDRRWKGFCSCRKSRKPPSPLTGLNPHETTTRHSSYRCQVSVLAPRIFLFLSTATSKMT